MSCAACGAADDLTRGVLFWAEPIVACMACGDVRAFEVEIEYSDNPHVDPTTTTRPTTIDAESLAWVSTFPRRARSVRARETFMRADVRAKDAAALDEAERAAPDAPTLRARLAAGGFPAAPPPRRTTFLLAPFFSVWDAFSFDARTPLDAVLKAAAANNESTALRLAREALDARPHAFAEIAQSKSLPLALVSLGVLLTHDRAPREEIDALADVLADRLAAIPVDHLFERSDEVGDIVHALALMQSGSARAAAALAALQTTELYAKRSTLRDGIARALRRV